MDRSAVRLHCPRRQQRTRRLIHKRHEFIGKARHRASNANAPHVRATANPAHPSSLAHVALHYRTPASELHNALWRSIFFSKFALLVISAAITSLMQRRAKQPRRTERLIERNHRCAPTRHIQKIENRLHHVVRLRRTPRDTHDRNSRRRLPLPTQIVRKSHATGGVSLHGMNST